MGNKTIQGYWKQITSYTNSTSERIPGGTFTCFRGAVTKDENSTQKAVTHEQSHEASIEIQATYGFSKLSSVQVTGKYSFTDKTSTNTVDQTLHSSEITTSQELQIPLPALNPGQAYYLYAPAFGVNNEMDVQFTFIVSNTPIDPSTCSLEITISGVTLNERLQNPFAIQSVSSDESNINKQPVLYHYDGYNTKEGYVTVYMGDDFVLQNIPHDLNCDWSAELCNSYDSSAGEKDRLFWLRHVGSGFYLSHLDFAGTLLGLRGKDVKDNPSSTEAQHSLWKIYVAPDKPAYVVIQNFRTQKVLSFYDPKMGPYAGDPWVIGQSDKSQNSSIWNLYPR